MDFFSIWDFDAKQKWIFGVFVEGKKGLGFWACVLKETNDWISGLCFLQGGGEGLGFEVKGMAKGKTS